MMFMQFLKEVLIQDVNAPTLVMIQNLLVTQQILDFLSFLLKEDYFWSFYSASQKDPIVLA